MKQKLVDYIRRCGVLPAVERLRFAQHVLRERSDNREYAQSNPDEPFPPNHVLYDAMSSTCYRAYFESGQRVARVLYSYSEPYLPQSEASVCEWGCGPARVIRHLRTIDPSRKLRLFGTDYNPASIAWCKSAISGVEFRLNDLAPPLPFPEDSFDWLYCVSVFTHLSEAMHQQWIREIFRVIKPGGIALITTHGDNFKDKLLPEELKQYTERGFVVRGRVTEGSRTYTAFQNPSFMRQLFTGQEILTHEPHPDPIIAGGQDVWIVRKTGN